MSPAQGRRPRKPKLDKQFLSRHSITLYEDGDEDRAKLPGYVRGVKRKLLNFPPLPSDFQSHFDENLNKVRFSGWGEFIECWSDKQERIQPVSLKPQPYMYCMPGSDLGIFGNVRRTAKVDLEKSEMIAEEAVELSESAESDWQDTYGKKLFKTFKCTLDDDLKGVRFMEMWSLHRDVQWSESLSANHGDEKRPRPDLTYAFPVSEIIHASFPPWSPEYSDNFSLDFLKRAGLSCMATDKIKKADKTLRKNDRMCYPWAIMEAKRDGDKESRTTECYSQAANGAAVALDMRANLYRKARGNVPENLPPIIAFTCIGPYLRVWLAWRVQSSQIRPETRMICIWATDVRLTWGAYSIRLVIENMHLWVIRNLKPEVSKQLGRIRASSHWFMTAPRRQSPAWTDPSGAKVYRSRTKAPVRTNELSNCEADISHPCDNLRNARNTPTSRASQAATSSSSTRRRRHVPDSAPTAVGSDQSDDEGSTTLVENEEDEFCYDLQGLSGSDAGRKGWSHSESESPGSSRQSPYHGAANQVAPCERSKGICNCSQHSDPALCGDCILVPDSGNSNTSISEEYPESPVDNRSQSDDADKSSIASQSDHDEYLEWIAAREAGLIEMVSSTLHGSEIMPLLCYGEAPTNVDRDHMVECIELLMFRPDSGRLEAWFIHDNWDLTVESELLEVVHLLNDSLARYSHTGRHTFPNSTRRQARRIRRALDLLCIHGKPKELVSLFSAILSCFSGESCLASLEAFGIILDDDDWGLLKQRCLDKGRIAEWK